ncbi:MAG: GNAT family N-acetyltransferase [Bacteroidota bacterium]
MISMHESSRPLSSEEKEIYEAHLHTLGLDSNIWDLYERFLQVSSAYSIPRIIRVMEGKDHLAHIYMIKCRDYGATLSRSGIIKSMSRLMGIPVYSWLRSGIAAENNANPGYLNTSTGDDNTMSKLIEHLKQKYFMIFILDLESNHGQYTNAVTLPYTDEGIVDTSTYQSIDDYRKQHKNLKKKFRVYRNHGGRTDIEKGRLSVEDQQHIASCVLSTSKKSVFKLPYQDIYPAMCSSSAEIDNDRIIHFLSRSDDQFFGYHSFIQFNEQMRCLNGAFNRELKSTYHAYENMIYKVIEYAIEQKIRTIYFGPVLNETKKRMMNQFLPTRLYVYSKFPLVLKLFTPILKNSRMANRQVLAFSGIETKKKAAYPSKQPS